MPTLRMMKPRPREAARLAQGHAARGGTWMGTQRGGPPAPTSSHDPEGRAVRPRAPRSLPSVWVWQEAVKKRAFPRESADVDPTTWPCDCLSGPRFPHCTLWVGSPRPHAALPSCHCVCLFHRRIRRPLSHAPRQVRSPGNCVTCFADRRREPPRW